MGNPLEEIPKSSSGRTALEVVQEVALKAGDLLVKRFSEPMEISLKGRGNIVTDVDLLVEKEVMALLSREYPEFALLGEESAAVRADEGYVWIIDPLDGTRNYASGTPFFSVVIALAHEGDVLLGVNYDPIRREMFMAQKGKGAYVNQKPISVSQKTRLEDCILGFDLGYNNEKALYALKLLEALWPGMQTIRIMGSSALGISYAAAGRIDLYFHQALEPWDVATGLLLVKEAGGVITDKNGGPAGLYSDGWIASNAILHQEFLKQTEGLEWRK